MPSFTKAPALTQNPNPRAPLAAVLTFATSQPVSGFVAIDDGKRTRKILVPQSLTLERSIAVVGMRPGKPNRITLHLNDNTSLEYPKAEFTYTPPPAPEPGIDFPPVNVKTCTPANMEPGFILLSVRRRPANRAIWWTEKQNTFATRWSMLLAVDEDGEVVWYYKHDSRIAGVDRLANGNLFFNQVNFQSTEIDMLGNVVGSWYAVKRPFGPAPGAIPIDAQSMHHQPHMMPNGNYLAMTANARVFDNYFTSETDPDAPRQTIPVVGDRIVEFDQAGNIVWSWNTFDHLDPYRIGYNLLDPYWDTRGFRNHADWTHGNGVCYDHRDDSVIMSLRGQDAIIKVDKSSGDIKWILGPHSGWDAQKQKKLLKPVGDNFRWPWHGHNPRVTPQGTIVMYDNSIFRARPFEPARPPSQCFSRGVEFEVDEEQMEVRQVWSSDSPRDDKLLSWAMGDAHRLPNTGNMLVIDSFCFPRQDPIDKLGRIRHSDLGWDEWERNGWHPSDFAYWARIRELQRDHARTVAFEAHVEDAHDIMGWEVFGGLKAPTLGPEVTD